jgi:hypothetical protein
VEVAFLELGTAADQYLRAAAAAGTPGLHQQLQRLLELVAICGTEPLQAALSRACQFGPFGWDDVRSILAAGGAAPPAQVVFGARVAVAGLPNVPPREPASYRWSVCALCQLNVWKSRSSHSFWTGSSS